ncbi:MAG: T9SS type A sorting domain-containing protein [Bacteroidales bacterium]|nr:T9SS type A sorting domain-containing protein [Bacteroidales bacterium]
MKKRNIFLLVVFACAMFVTKAQVTVTMTNVTEITAVKATFNAYFTNSGATVNSKGFMWSLNSDFSGATKQSVSGTTPGDFSYAITQAAKYLNPNTTYYVRAWVRTKTGSVYDTVFSSSHTFVTLPAVPPTATADDATNVMITSATLAGTVSDFGDAASITGKGFVYGTTSNPTAATGTMIAVAGSVTASGLPKTFTADITNLFSGTTYYYRTYTLAKYNNTVTDTCYSEQKTFHTPYACDSVPYALTKDSVTITDAYLHWTPRAGQNSFEIDYGFAGHTAGEGTILPFTGSQAHLENLMGGRSYSAFVRASCGEVYSDWSEVVSFTTMPSLCAEVSGLHTEDVAHSSARIEWTPGSVTQTKWEIQFAKFSENYPMTYTTINNSPVFSPIGLTPNTKYKMKVRANCDPYYSDWTEEFTFTTLVMGLEEAEENYQVKVYPNPSENTVYFDKQDAQVQKVEIYNAMGANLYTMEDVPESINLARFGQGIYFIHITSAKGVQIEKVIIK